MNYQLYLAIIITSLIWIIVTFIIYFNSNKKVETILRKTNLNLEKLNSEFNVKLENLLKSQNEKITESFNKGYSESENKKELSIEIIPWKEEFDSGSFFKNKRSLKTGYKRQLLFNGMPCFEPHLTIVEEITVEKLNEENITRVFNNLDLVMNNIPNTGNLIQKISGSAKDLGKTLINQTNKNKKL